MLYILRSSGIYHHIFTFFWFLCDVRVYLPCILHPHTFPVNDFGLKTPADT